MEPPFAKHTWEDNPQERRNQQNDSHLSRSGANSAKAWPQLRRTLTVTRAPPMTKIIKPL